jgi:hypothetical protein
VVTIRILAHATDFRVSYWPLGNVFNYYTLKPNSMENAYYSFTVPVFINTLSSLKNILKKGEDFTKSNNKSDEEMLMLRLAPDMFPLVKQVQISCDYAKGASARLAGKEVPKMEDNERTFTELYARIDKTLEYLKTFTEKDFVDADKVVIKMQYFPQNSHLTGDGYARFYVIPNFFFHVTTAYDILRTNGVNIGKGDFAGNLPFQNN